MSADTPPDSDDDRGEDFALAVDYLRQLRAWATPGNWRAAVMTLAVHAHNAKSERQQRTAAHVVDMRTWLQAKVVDDEAAR
jgi:hypothetical protein